MKNLSLTFWYAILCIGFVVVLGVELVLITSKYSSVQSETTKLSEDTENLKVRLSALQNVKPEITENIEKTTIALPSKNSSLSVASQIRRIAKDHLVNVKNLALNIIPGTATGELSGVQVTYTVNGTTSDILDFLNDLLTAAPIISFDTISLLTNETESSLQVGINSFWSPFPTKLPGLNDPIVALSENEEDLLNFVSGLKAPIFSEEVSDSTASASAVKENPFSN